jgi:steroid 5-alpha reductase family enzyme
MKRISTNASVLAVAISISILGALVSTDVNAFAVHAQIAGMPISHVHDSTSDTRQSIGKPTSSLGTFSRHRQHKIMPTTETALSAAAALPALGQFAAAAFLPCSLGLWRTGYAVCYGFGGAMMASGLLQLFANLPGSAQAILPLHLHAALYVCFGARLNLFLLHREIKFPVEIHKMTRKDASLLERLKRLPIITGCSVLYYCMSAAPMRVLALLNPPKGNALTTTTLAVGFAGFLLAAVGDWYKCKIKARDGKDTLVTTGPYRYLRHPNYTGDTIGWTCVCLVLPLLSAMGNFRRVIPWLAASIFGWAGIVFAVMIGEATMGLEKKQKEKYGGTPEYEEWIKKSWAGPMLGGKDNSKGD